MSDTTVAPPGAGPALDPGPRPPDPDRPACAEGGDLAVDLPARGPAERLTDNHLTEAMVEVALDELTATLTQGNANNLDEHGRLREQPCPCRSPL